MTPGAFEDQLELFDVSSQPILRPRRESLGRWVWQVRHDQLVLAGMAGLIGVTVVFACGVERGKQLVRFEHVLLARQEPESARPATSSESSAAPGREPTAAVQEPKRDKQRLAPVQTPGATPKPVTKVASRPSSEQRAPIGKTRYAIQVVTYSRPHLARQELERLQALGERAFLMIREGRTIVYVGPFPSKGNATQKLTGLKVRYQDCFIKTL